MALSTANRDTTKYNETTLHLNYPVKGGVHLYQGTIGALNASGLLIAAGASGTVKTVGRITAEVDATGYSDGALTLNVEEGIYWLDNSSGGDLIAQADVGKDCYVVDDHTVAKTDNSGARARMGKIINIDPVKGVAVRVELSH